MESYASYVAMVIIQLAYGGSNILIKVALEKGLNQLVFVAYRHIIATILLAPFAYVLERKQRPSLSFSVLTKIFFSSLGTTIHLNLYYIGLVYTSPTVASALSNVIPCLTFLMAVLLGMEEVKIRSAGGWAKMFGTAVCIGGSLIFTFWKGGYLFRSFEERPLINLHGIIGHTSEHISGNENWIKGSALILISDIVWSAWLVLQAVMYKAYPAPLSLNAFICFFASIQSCALALFLGRDHAIWKLDWNVQLLTIIYCGVVISALVCYLQLWCISNKGPVFASMFSPLLVVIVALFSAIAFAERLQLSSLVGAVVIIIGFYCVLWGKRQDSIAAIEPEEKGKPSADDNMLKISINDCSSTDYSNFQMTNQIKS